jgi:hypothetical protein
MVHYAPMRTATYDLGFAWEWTYDADFVRFLLEACLLQGVSCTITPENLGAQAALASGTLLFRVFFDRLTRTTPSCRSRCRPARSCRCA